MILFLEMNTFKPYTSHLTLQLVLIEITFYF